MASDSLDQQLKEILDKLDVIIVTLEDLMENPIFLDNIHGEQEMSLDLALELLDSIAARFEPAEESAPQYPLTVDDSYDAD